MQPYETGDNSFFVNIALLAFSIIFSIVGGYYIKYRRQHRKFSSRGSSILLAYYTDGVDVYPMKNGLFGNLHYVAFATSPTLHKGGEAALVYQVVLPFKSSVHLAGIPKKYGATQLFPAGGKSIMEKVDLEGDYNDYFTLYAEAGMQIDSRYVMDPKAMVFTIDFCQSHNWEIVGNLLYFVQATPNAPDDPTNMADDVETFINEIKPALGQSLTDRDLQNVTPYNQEYRTDLKCPICQSVLKNRDSYLLCPNGDGILIKGQFLMQLREGKLKIDGIDKAYNKKSHGLIVCPSCGNQMAETAFDGGSIIIDTCTHCPYRWLDATEDADIMKKVILK
jgi:hypothetical protein